MHHAPTHDSAVPDAGAVTAPVALGHADPEQADSVQADPELATSEPTAPEQVAPARFHAPMVSFVQRSTRLKDRQQRTWDALAPRYVIEPPRVVSKTSVQPEFLFDPEAAFGRSAPLVVEIGSGQGEAIAHAAQQRPDTNFLAVEVYTAGVAQTLQRIRQHDLTNIRIVQANAVEVLTTMLPAGCADELWLFFPDPWHKAKHTKRRIVTASFMDLAARVLAPGGVWRLATDWADYARQMREVIGADARFTAELHAPRFEGRVLTSFERKGLDKDRDIADITAVHSPDA